MKQVVLLSMLLSLVLLTGCRGIGGALVVGGYPHVEYAPPAHAPAHGRRHQRMYHYYPNAEFYFDVSRNMYFYLGLNGSWSFSVNLPHRLRSHLHSGYVEIEMDDARPYKRHSYHKNKYKKHKYKYKNKYERSRDTKNYGRHKKSKGSRDTKDYGRKKSKGSRDTKDYGRYKKSKGSRDDEDNGRYNRGKGNGRN
jgi:hypothetical protein